MIKKFKNKVGRNFSKDTKHLKFKGIKSVIKCLKQIANILYISIFINVIQMLFTRLFLRFVC